MSASAATCRGGAPATRTRSSSRRSCCSRPRSPGCVPRYEAWLARWPTAEALAAAALEDVLREWVGLGYNRRARAPVGGGAGGGARRVAGAPARAAGRRARTPPPRSARSPSAARRSRWTPTRGASSRGWGRRSSRRPGARRTSTRRRWSSARRCARRARRAATRARSRTGCDGPEQPAPRARARERFEDSNRWVRGRVVAALAAGEGVPHGIAPERLAPALQGLLRDGLIRQVAGGYALG